MKLKNGEKFAFLKLAYYMANIDGEFDKEEQNIIEEYCAEMGIENVPYDSDEFDFKQTLQQIKSKKSQKIIILELMILIYSDDKFHRFEDDTIKKIATFFKINEATLNIYSQWGKMASALYQQGSLMINDEIL